MTPSSNRTIRIGIIGAGDVAERHLEGLRGEPGLVFTRVADPDSKKREALAAAYRIHTTHAEAEEVIRAPDVDLLLILTPHDLHLPQTTAALRAGKDVFCEKPMGRTVAECDAMLQAAAESRRQLFITHSLRSEFFYLLTKRRLEAKAIGRPLLGVFFWYTDEIQRLEDPRHWKGTRGRSGGGVFIDGGCHVADLGNAFFGPARRVTARAGKLIVQAPDRGEDNGVFTVEYRSGALAACTVSFTAGGAIRIERFGAGLEMGIAGTEGRIDGGYVIRDQDFHRYFRERRAGVPDAEHHPPASLPSIDQLLLRAYRDGTPPPVTAVDARNAVAVVEAAYRSLESGRTEEVDWREA